MKPPQLRFGGVFVMDAGLILLTRLSAILGQVFHPADGASPLQVTPIWHTTQVGTPNCISHPDGIFPDPTDCRRYYHCVRQKTFYFRCFDGYVFDKCQLRCIFQKNCILHNADCSNNNTITSPATESTVASTSFQQISSEIINPPIKIVKLEDTLNDRIPFHNITHISTFDNKAPEHGSLSNALIKEKIASNDLTPSKDSQLEDAGANTAADSLNHANRTDHNQADAAGSSTTEALEIALETENSTQPAWGTVTAAGHSSSPSARSERPQPGHVTKSSGRPVSATTQEYGGPTYVVRVIFNRVLSNDTYTTPVTPPVSRGHGMSTPMIHKPIKDVQGYSNISSVNETDIVEPDTIELTTFASTEGNASITEDNQLELITSASENPSGLEQTTFAGSSPHQAEHGQSTRTGIHEPTTIASHGRGQNEPPVGPDIYNGGNVAPTVGESLPGYKALNTSEPAENRGTDGIENVSHQPQNAHAQGSQPANCRLHELNCSINASNSSSQESENENKTVGGFDQIFKGLEPAELFTDTTESSTPADRNQNEVTQKLLASNLHLKSASMQPQAKTQNGAGDTIDKDPLAPATADNSTATATFVFCDCSGNNRSLIQARTNVTLAKDTMNTDQKNSEKPMSLSEYCNALTCLNGGMFVHLTNGQCGCVCLPAWKGDRCQHLVDNAVCHCANGGRCVAVGNGSYACLCPKGYIGGQCQYPYTDTVRRKPTPAHMPAARPAIPHAADDQLVPCRADDPAAKPCQNGGVCMKPVRNDSHGNSDEKCFCAEGYSGDLCEYQV